MKLIEIKDNQDDDDSIDLPSISNESLLDQCKFHNAIIYIEYILPNIGFDEYSLKPNLVEGLNFTLIPEKLFFVLRDHFGVALEDRDLIKRTVVHGTLMKQSPFVEIYLHELKVHFGFFSNIFEYILDSEFCK